MASAFFLNEIYNQIYKPHGGHLPLPGICMYIACSIRMTLAASRDAHKQGQSSCFVDEQVLSTAAPLIHAFAIHFSPFMTSHPARTKGWTNSTRNEQQMCVCARVCVYVIATCMQRCHVHVADDGSLCTIHLVIEVDESSSFPGFDYFSQLFVGCAIWKLEAVTFKL